VAFGARRAWFGPSELRMCEMELTGMGGGVTRCRDFAYLLWFKPVHWLPGSAWNSRHQFSSIAMCSVTVNCLWCGCVHVEVLSNANLSMCYGARSDENVLDQGLGV
jgi:hypothetical protein